MAKGIDGLDDKGAAGSVHPECPHRDRRAVKTRERHDMTGRDLAIPPAGDIESPATEGRQPRLQPPEEPVEQGVPVDRPAARDLPERGHGKRQGRWKVSRGPGGIDPDPHDHPRIGRSEALGLAEDPGELAQGEGRRAPLQRIRCADVPDQERIRASIDDDQVVGPFQPDGALAQPGHVLGRVGHREGHDRGEPPDLCRVEPGGPEANRAEQRCTFRRGPGPAVPPSPGVLLVGHGDADLARALGQPGSDDVIGRADGFEPLEAGIGGQDVRGRHPAQPAARPVAASSIGSGRASSNAL